MVHTANVQDRDGAKLVIAKLAGLFPRLRKKQTLRNPGTQEEEASHVPFLGSWVPHSFVSGSGWPGVAFQTPSKWPHITNAGPATHRVRKSPEKGDMEMVGIGGLDLNGGDDDVFPPVALSPYPHRPPIPCS